MRIVFTGGGTGGHVLPNLAIIEELRGEGRRPKAKVFYIGEKNGPEEELVKKSHVPFYGIHAGKLRRYFDLKNFIDIFKIPIGFFEAIRIFRKLKPSLVFATGGYVSFPVILAARFLRIPVWLHELDVSSGLANKMCARFAEKIWLSFEEIGNPIRRKILEGKREEGYKLTGFSPKRPTILVMGGSSGAQSLNKLISQILPDLLKKTQIVHITGPVANYPITQLPNHQSYKSFPFLNDELAHIYAIIDLAISRSGSGSIFELLALKKPMILIPLPRQASRGDQIENAQVFEKHGWARALDQNTLTPQELLKNILELLTNKKMRSRMIESQEQVHFEDAAEKIVTAIKNYDLSK